jgi:hypothetical protein
MGNLACSTSHLNMNKAVASLWFRIPQVSVDAVRAATSGSYFGYPVFDGVIPLVTWGPQQTPTITETERYDSGSIDESGGIIYLERISGSHTTPTNPSCIGVNVGGDEQKPYLAVHIQTNVHASASGLLYITTGFTGTFVGISVTPPYVGYPVYTDIVYTKEDVSFAITDTPEFLGNTLSGAGYPEVKVDEWNHVLISWELIGGNANKMWCAINDENKDGNDLPAMCDVSTMGPNGHSSSTLYYSVPPDGSASVTFRSDSVPSTPVQTPGPLSANQATDAAGATAPIQPIKNVELADLQIFTGVTLDTSSVANRRAFVDANGLPVPPAGTAVVVEPGAPPSLAVGGSIELLGKKPEIVLRGSGNWIGGRNTGTLGMAGNGVSIPSGQFVPTGRIIRYVPDPQLSGHSVLPTTRKVQLSKRPVREGVFRR